MRHPSKTRQSLTAGVITTKMAAARFGISLHSLRDWKRRGIISGLPYRHREWCHEWRTLLEEVLAHEPPTPQAVPRWDGHKAHAAALLRELNEAGEVAARRKRDFQSWLNGEVA